MTMLEAPIRQRRAPGPTPRHAYSGRGAAAVAVAPARDPERRPRPDARPNHLRVVAPNDRARRRLSPATAVLLTAGLFALLLAVAVSHTVLVQGQVRLDELDAQLRAEQARYQELRKDVSELESPGRVVEEAHAQGMVTPDDLQYLQPPAPDATSVGPETGDDHEPGSDPTVVRAPDRPWSELKSMLEATP